jgi:hypothetical protein
MHPIQDDESRYVNLKLLFIFNNYLVEYYFIQ